MREAGGMLRGSSERDAVESLVARLLALAADEEVCRLLGVDGVLADQLDINFLEDALDYATYDIATAIFDARDDRGSTATAPMLSTLVAEVKLCRLLSVRLDLQDLVQRIIEHLRALEA
jgi:hypothetical protein